MHGVRYLDIRVGYYRATEPQFWVNHGISRQQPLIKVLRQVRDFVLETNEIVIFDVQEFPVGKWNLFILLSVDLFWKFRFHSESLLFFSLFRSLLLFR